MVRGRFDDLVGKKFGKLTVIKRAKNRGHNTCWLCQCECGNLKEALASNLKTGVTNSCGCITKEKIIKAVTKHNETKTRLYRLWSNMKQRCYNKKQPTYKYYGARGIRVCQEWKNNYESFRDWAITNGYSDKLTIDRIDVNGNYEPTNCRWITNTEQQQNKSNNRLITYNNEEHCISEWARILDINTQTLFKRLDRGFAIERALTKK